MLKKTINKVCIVKTNSFRKSTWFDRMSLCPYCHGTGYIVYKTELIKCFVCAGTGKTL